MARILNILIALDQFLFCLICLGNTQRGETASASAWACERDGKFFGFTRQFIDAMFYVIEKNHCYESWKSEQYLYKKGP